MVKIASFLTESEARSVEAELTGRKITFFMSRGGTVPGSYHDPYYQVTVSASDYFVARKIVARVMSRGFIEGRKCPKCKEVSYRTLEKTSLWERIYYFRVTKVECLKCRTVYSI